MGFFSRLFSSGARQDPQPDQPQTPPDASVPFVTNAPDGWPRLSGDPAALADDMVSRITFFAAVAEAFGKDVEMDMEGSFLVEGGVLRVPVSVQHEGRWYGLFPYPEPTREAAAHFAGVQAAAADEAWTPVYVSTGPLPDGAAPADVLVRGFLGLPNVLKDLPPDDYAMWWPPTTSAGPERVDLSGLATWTRIYEALDGIHSYVFAAMARQIGLVPDDEPVARAALPDELLVHRFRGPEDRVLLLSASQEKGIRIHFPHSTTPDVYRKRFLDQFATYVEGWKAGALERGFPLDPPVEGDEHPLGWWQLMVRVAEDFKAKGEFDGDSKLGIIPMRREDGA